MNKHHYLYAIAAADCPLPPLGAGVDPRFPVEALPCGRLAALASCVGLDRFDPEKLQAGTADVRWLSEVAVRHNEIIGQAAECGPLLPLRLGVLFQSRASLFAKVTGHETRVVDFLRSLGDHREWAVKVYVDEARAEAGLLADDPDGAGSPEPAGAPRATPGQGALYLATRKRQLARGGQIEAAVRVALLAVGKALNGLADAWRQLHPLPRALLDRPERMVWNGAFLLARAQEDAFHAACRPLRRELDRQGLDLEASGPWPAYHFCPTLDTEGATGAAASLGH